MICVCIPLASCTFLLFINTFAAFKRDPFIANKKTADHNDGRLLTCFIIKYADRFPEAQIDGEFSERLCALS